MVNFSNIFLKIKIFDQGCFSIQPFNSKCVGEGGRVTSAVTAFKNLEHWIAFVGPGAYSVIQSVIIVAFAVISDGTLRYYLCRIYSKVFMPS